MSYIIVRGIALSSAVGFHIIEWFANCETRKFRDLPGIARGVLKSWKMELKPHQPPTTEFSDQSHKITTMLLAISRTVLVVFVAALYLLLANASAFLSSFNLGITTHRHQQVQVPTSSAQPGFTILSRKNESPTKMAEGIDEQRAKVGIRPPMDFKHP